MLHMYKSVKMKSDEFKFFGLPFFLFFFCGYALGGGLGWLVVRSEFASAKIRQRHTEQHFGNRHSFNQSITFIRHRYIVQNKFRPHLCSFYDIIIKDTSRFDSAILSLSQSGGCVTVFGCHKGLFCVMWPQELTTSESKCT